MTRIAEELDAKLRSLDPARARYLESLVQQAIERAERGQPDEPPTAWPAGYFEKTSGALEGEELERSLQGELPQRENW